MIDLLNLLYRGKNILLFHKDNEYSFIYGSNAYIDPLLKYNII